MTRAVPVRITCATLDTAPTAASKQRTEKGRSTRIEVCRFPSPSQLFYLRMRRGSVFPDLSVDERESRPISLFANCEGGWLKYILAR